MRYRLLLTAGLTVLGTLLLVGTPRAQRAGLFQGSADDDRVQYSTGPLDNIADRLNQQLEAGTLTLTYEGTSGYLPSLLKAMGLQTDSQLLVFSKGSLQGRRINQENPRALYFNETAAVGFVRGGEALEVIALDPKRGVVFYTLPQKQVEKPRFKREMICLGCHMTGDTQGVPGLLMFSTTPETPQAFGSIVFTRHNMPVSKRFGGWLVTGASVESPHLGNGLDKVTARPAPVLPSTEGLYDQEGYLTHRSDVAALMVFSHQVGMVDQIVRANWEGKMVGAKPSAGELTVLSAVAEDLVDMLLFIDEARAHGPVVGNSGFTERFQASGPKDAKGRSLHELDLKTRLQKYPCSYMIYSPIFDGLPPVIKDLVYQRMWKVLSGAVKDERHRAALSRADRQAIVEILRDTKPDLPAYFRQPISG